MPKKSYQTKKQAEAREANNILPRSTIQTLKDLEKLRRFIIYGAKTAVAKIQTTVLF